jgi:hypothetical protein
MHRINSFLLELGGKGEEREHINGLQDRWPAYKIHSNVDGLQDKEFTRITITVNEQQRLDEL